MEVILQKDFFAPNGSIYKSRGPSTSVEVPDEFRNKLPETAKVVKQRMAVSEEPKSTENPLVSLEEAAADSLAKVNEEAEVTRRKGVRRKKVTD